MKFYFGLVALGLLNCSRADFNVAKDLSSGIQISKLYAAGESLGDRLSYGSQGALEFLHRISSTAGMNPLITVIKDKGNSYRYTLEDIPFCLETIEVHHLPDGSVAVQGHAPEITGERFTIILPEKEHSFAFVENYAASKHLNREGHKILREEACIISDPEAKTPRGVWDFSVSFSGLSYRFFATPTEIHHFEKLFFAEGDTGGQPLNLSLTLPPSGPGQTLGRAKIYERNSNSPVIEATFYNDGKGSLDSSWFVTTTGDVPRAVSPNNEFFYEPSAPQFAEVSIFTQATKAMEWYVRLGFDPGNSYVGLGVHSVIGNTINNALYVPNYETNDHAQVRIGDGDGVTLRNLATDSDVVRHELAHHIIYRKLKSSFGDSSVIHEGLADYFAMSQGNDPCIGPTICPANSDVCQVKGQCLRTAKNNFTWQSSFPGNRPHLKGQVLSGMLWDLRTFYGIPAYDLDRLVYGSIDFLLPNSKIPDLIGALYAADQKLFGGKYRPKIELSCAARELL